MAELVKGVDAIVNFAAETHVDRSISNPFAFIESNVIGTYTILEAMRKINPEAKLSFKEDDTLRPSSPYSASKASADMFVLAYARTYGLNAVITRCTNNYGPYQFPEKLIPKAIIRAKMDMKIPIYGTGKNVRDWIYVKDHAEAINLVLEKGVRGEIYNVSSGEEKTNLAVINELLEIMAKNDLIEFVEDRPGHDIRYSLDSSKIRGLGWTPKHGFEDGLKETIEWYQENEWISSLKSWKFLMLS
jgi:dTDP-glucose 4,6-dehydratase